MQGIIASIYFLSLETNLMFLTPMATNIEKNPIIKRLEFKIKSYKNNNTNLDNYLSTNLNRILNIQTEIEHKSSINNLNKNITKIDLSLSWNLLKDFKKVPGIYQFVSGSESYIGSTKDIYNRCFIQHKNSAFTSPNKHKKFYSLVVNNGWSKFTLNILKIVFNHVNVFSEKYPNDILTAKDLQVLQYLTLYELTLTEQLYLDLFKPSLNKSLLANWSTYNVGAKGYIRTNKVNENLSLALLNRKFSLETTELHRQNNTGKTFSELTKAKMSLSSGGVKVKLIDLSSNNSIIEFKNKSLVAKELNISLRTVTRWIEDGKVHLTHSIKYPKVILTK